MLAENATGSQGESIGLDTELVGLMDIGGDFTSVSITIRRHRSAASVSSWRAKRHSRETTMSRTLQPIEESNPGKSSGKISFTF